ncbi:NEDD1 isoform X2 [Olea europaea subsp. europaea]|uniref:NEDD1 isoform X2 n=2 Tax=Olea europaea subsp. europaea TaxID=158383 RepID=A0A8S0UQ16_OLEEU|nr:NEDD1 isoform X2 [Olea europaea subsp. europaea]
MSRHVSWLRQHSAPTSGVCFSPSNDKIIASVGLDMKLYTFDSGSRKPSSCIPYEAPFSSLAFTDDGLTLAAGTSTGQVAFYDVRGKPQPITVLHAYGNSEAITSLCWQRSKAVTVNEASCTDETVLMAGDVGDSILMPDPLPSMASSNFSMSSAVSGSQNSSHSAETPLRSSSLTSGSLGRLLAPRRYNLKDDMEIFSPLLEVQPNTHSFDLMWDGSKGSKKDFDYNSSNSFLSGSFALSEDWKTSSTTKQGDIPSTFSQLTSTQASTLGDITSSITPPEAWGGERLSDKLMHFRQSVNMSSRYPTLTSGSLSSGSMLSGLQDTPHPTSTTGVTVPSKLDSLGPPLSFPRRFSSYAERIGATTSFDDLSTGSPKTNETGAEMREEISNSLLSRSNVSSASRSSVLPARNGGATLVQETTLHPDSKHENSFTLQLFQHTLEEGLGSFQKSMHEDMRNLHIEILRQFHMQEMESSGVMKLILENQAEIMKEIQSLRKETQQLRQLL